MQLLTVVIPSSQRCRSRARSGVKKINQCTRYVTVVLALLQSTGLVFLFHSGPAEHPRHLPAPGPSPAPNVALIVLDADRRHRHDHVAGRAHHAAGRGQRHVHPDLHERDLAACPARASRSCAGRQRASSSSILLLGVAIIVAVVFMDQGQRRIPVQYAKRVVGRKMTAGGSTYLPLKVNQAGVIPIIFATSVMYFPTLLASVYHARRRSRTSSTNNFTNQPQLRLHGHPRHVDRVLRLLLHGDPVRPASNRRTTSGSRAGSSPASGRGRPPRTT